MKLKREIGKPRAVFAELNAPFSVTDSIEKVNKNLSVEALNKTIN